MPVAVDHFTYVVPVLTTDPVAIPAFAAGNGYFFTVTSHATGTISATWTSPIKLLSGTLAIYAGNPFAGRPNPVKLSAPAGALAATTGKKSSFAVSIAGRPAGAYTVYFFSGSAAVASVGTVTYMK